MFELLPWLISAGASLGSSIISNIGASDRQDAMNAYNSPAQQMARYTAAGLNPNLIYGSGGSAGNQASPAAFMSPDVDPIRVWSAMEEIRKKREQQKLMRSQEALSGSNQELIKLRGELVNAQTELANRSSKALDIKNAWETLKNNAQAPYLGDNARYQSQLMQHGVEKTILGNKNLGQLYNNLVSQYHLNEVTKSHKEALIKNLGADYILKHQDMGIKRQIFLDKKYGNELHNYGLDRGGDRWSRMAQMLIPSAFKYAPLWNLPLSGYKK